MDAGHVPADPGSDPPTPGSSRGFRGPHAGPAQQRYGDYFCRVLYSRLLPRPEGLTVLLSQIVFNGLELLNVSLADSGGDMGMWLDDSAAPFLVIFQHGRRVWAGFPESRVRPSCCDVGEREIAVIV